MKQFSVIDKKTGRLTTIWFKYGKREFKSVREITERFKDIDENDTKQMKLDELKAMVRAWKKEKGLTLAYDICEFLANNLDLEDGDDTTQ